MISRAKALKELVASLGFKIVKYRSYTIAKNGYYISHKDETGWHTSIFTSYQAMQTALFTKIQEFSFYNDFISKFNDGVKNPYFGCKSLEEALIKKDLNYAANNS